MKKKYADFAKLNRLLVACFEAEKLYYNAAQDAQTTDLKRFLNYMAVERNRMSHDISNELHSRDIEPLKQDSEKGNLDRTWQEIKDALEYFDADVASYNNGRFYVRSPSKGHRRATRDLLDPTAHCCGVQIYSGRGAPKAPNWCTRVSHADRQQFIAFEQHS